MSKKIKIGILGCAQIAGRSVIPAMQELEDLFEVVGVASRQESTVQPFAAKLGVHAVVGYDELLELPELDAVYLPLPNGLHAEWIEKALAKGLHVLVEKSLACCHSEVVRLNELAGSKSLALIENFQFRCHPQIQLIQEVLQSGRIGDLRCVRSSFGFPPFPDADNIRYDKALGGGALLDAGAYTLKISQMILGQNLTVAAANLESDGGQQVDIWGGAYLKQVDGSLFSEVAFGFDQQYQCNLDLWGSKGRLTTNRLFTAPPNYSAEVIVEIGMEREVLSVEPANHFKKMLQHFYEATSRPDLRELEYAQNINQARLIAEVFAKAAE